MNDSIRAIGEPTLELLYEMHVDLDPPQVIGQTPYRMRQIFYVRGGTADGPRIRGKVLPGGGDWALIRSDGVLQLDVRASLQTDDGALVYATYNGLLDIPPELFATIARGEDVPRERYYFYTAPMFQTAAPQYAWLNRLLAVGKGGIVPGGVEYRVWALA